jgi:hypothetical protein
MSRNEDKIGVSEQSIPSSRDAFNGEERSPVQPQAPQQPQAPSRPMGLKFINPTQFVDLPSQGRYYPDGHPLKDVKTIEFSQMTTHEENILTNASLERHGTTFDVFLRNIIVDKQIDPENMLTGDRGAVIIASRIYGFGHEYPTSVQCPMCGKVINGKINLYEAIDSAVEDMKNIKEFEEAFGVKWTSERTFTVPLNRTGWTVECMLMTGKDELEQFQREKVREKNRQHDPDNPLYKDDKYMTEFLNKIIVSIDGNDGAGPRKNRGELKVAIDSMPSIDSRVIKDVYKKINPRIPLYQDLQCSKCRYEGVIEVPIGPKFFPII